MAAEWPATSIGCIRSASTARATSIPAKSTPESACRNSSATAPTVAPAQARPPSAAKPRNANRRQPPQRVKHYKGRAARRGLLHLHHGPVPFDAGAQHLIHRLCPPGLGENLDFGVTGKSLRLDRT